jgi:rare lipoprotein A
MRVLRVFVVYVLCVVTGFVLGQRYTLTQKVVPLMASNERQVRNLSYLIEQLQMQVAELRTFQESVIESRITGVASWYGRGDGCSVVTATGERFDVNRFAVAHRTLPLGTYVVVRSRLTGRQAFAILNDRGPYVKGREFDLTWGLAQELGITRSGLSEVELLVLGRKFDD